MYCKEFALGRLWINLIALWSIWLLILSAAWGPTRVGAAEPVRATQGGLGLTQAAPAGATPASSSSFASGSWLLTGYGSVAAGASSEEVFAGHLGVSYHLWDGLSIGVEGVGYGVNQKDNTGGLGLDALFRWHFLQRDSGSLYIDGGVGVVYTHKRFTESGTHFNFVSQGGLGVTFPLTPRVSFMGGVRWLHISNADIRGRRRNANFDNPRFYAGVVVPVWK